MVRDNETSQEQPNDTGLEELQSRVNEQGAGMAELKEQMASMAKMIESMANMMQALTNATTHTPSPIIGEGQVT